MRWVKILLIILAVGCLLLPAAVEVEARSGRVPEINTRGACLNVNEFVGLIRHESRRLKSGDSLRLIADIPNETEAREAIATSGFNIAEETRDEDRDFINFLLQVVK